MPFSFLPAATGAIDFVVRAFSPHEIEASATREIRISSPEAGSFRVEDGKRILFDSLPDVDNINFWQSFAHPCFGVLIQQRGWIALHASSVKAPHGAVLFLGPSGAGKSTLASALHDRGFPLISDEIAAVSQDATPRVAPAFPLALLWDRRSGSVNKFAKPRREGFPLEPVPIRLIYILNRQIQACEPRVSSLGSLESLKALLDNSYKPFYLRQMGLLNAHSAAVAGLVGIVPHYRLTYSASDEKSLVRLCELVESLQRGESEGGMG
jgi:hypothetical protein